MRRTNRLFENKLALTGRIGRNRSDVVDDAKNRVRGDKQSVDRVFSDVIAHIALSETKYLQLMFLIDAVIQIIVGCGENVFHVKLNTDLLSEKYRLFQGESKLVARS